MTVKIKNTSPAGGIHRQILAVSLACTPTLVYGLLIGWVSATLRLLQSAETPASAPLSDLAVSVLAGVLSFGAAAGTPFFVYAADRFGRKPTIMLISFMFALSWTLKLASAEPAFLITARVVAGIGSGGLFISIPIYVREVSQDSIRGTLGVLVMVSYNLGVITIYTLGIYVPFWLSLAVCLGICVLHFLFFMFMPETPVYCVKKQRYDEAARNLAWLRNKKKNDDCIAEEIEKLKKDELIFQELPKVSLFGVLKKKPVMRSFRLAVGVLLLQQMSGNFALVSFATSIFERAHAPWSPEHLGLVVSTVQLAGSFISVSLVDSCGRKPLLLASSLAISCFMGALGTWFVLDARGVLVPDWLPVLAVCGSIFSYGLGLLPLPGVIMAEIFNFQYRARLIAIPVTLAWVAASSVLVGFMPLASAVGASACFYVFCGASLLGAAFVALCLPETKGRSYEEIESFFTRKGDPVEHSGSVDDK